jgi:nucleoid-associated protein YgaU
MGLDDTPPAADAVPTFDVVRVEPSGDTVIAGLAAPEARVEVLDGAEPVATAEANERGEWALVLETPLPPGTHDLAIRTTSPDKSVVTLSDQRVAVAVPEKPGEAPLVVLNAPDAPSTVMQLPAEPEVAAAPEAPSTPEALGTAPAPQASTTPEPSTPEASTPEPGAPPAVPAETEIASVPPPAAEPAAPTTAPETPAPPMATAPETPPAATPETPPPAGTATSEEPAPSTAPTAPAPGPEVATAPQEEAAPPAAAAEETPAPPPVVEEPEPEPEVGVAAVEAETNGALYIAGTATEPGPVRVYVDDELVGEATPTEGGTWLIETEREMPPGEYTIRADQIEEGSDKVVVRAEVPFEREIEVAVLKQSNESADPGGAEVSGSLAGPMSVIIKRGDSLWRISREMYGHGVRYSTIYQANKDQIRNPNRIYPGQVFMVPQGDTAWQN